MSRADMAAVEIDSVLWFFSTDLGQTVRQQAERVQREVAFVSRVEPQRLDPLVHPRDHRDVLLVRGVVDLLLLGRNELVIADYKTDALDTDGCEARAENYRTQLAYYADALTAAYNLPVTHQYLMFMHARRVVELTPSAGA